MECRGEKHSVFYYAVLPGAFSWGQRRKSVCWSPSPAGPPSVVYAVALTLPQTRPLGVSVDRHLNASFQLPSFYPLRVPIISMPFQHLAHTLAHTLTHTHAHEHTHSHINALTLTNTHTHMHTLMHSHTHTHILTLPHTHTHTYTCQLERKRFLLSTRYDIRLQSLWKSVSVKGHRVNASSRHLLLFSDMWHVTFYLL